jgi:hypothetical protein
MPNSSVGWETSGSTWLFCFLGDHPMQNKNIITKEANDHQGILEDPKALSKKVRFGAPDGPRRHPREKNDYQSPLEYPGHEATAQFLATAKSIREFKSDEDLAKHFHVTRQTIFRWRHDADVIQRALFLSEKNQMAGDLLARQEWPGIMERVVQKAIKGDLQSIKFCESRAWPKEPQFEQSHVSATVSMQDLLGTNESEDARDLADKNQKAKEGDQ